MPTSKKAKVVEPLVEGQPCPRCKKGTIDLQEGGKQGPRLECSVCDATEAVA